MRLSWIKCVVLRAIAIGCAFAQDEATFRTQTRLVMLPFHTDARDLDRAGVVLLEDGKPREFSIFDVPSDAHRMPVEVVLLFDANPKAGRLWDPAGAFPFVKQWNDAMSRALLSVNGDIKISVYRCAGQKLYRSTAATGDPQALTRALRGILSPLPSTGEAGTIAELHLPPQRDRITTTDRYTREYVTSRFLKAEDRGWTLEAAIGVLDQMALPGDRVSRVLAMFSEGIGATTTIPEDVGDEALDLGIPVYPVATNYKGHITRTVPRNLFRMRKFQAIGKMTGGRAVEHTSIDAATLQKILTDVKVHALEQYVVGFAPSSSVEAKQHTLEVRLSSGAGVEGGKRRATY